jgi:hypothetical protein
MFTIAGVLKMFGGKLDKIIDKNGGALKFSEDKIEEFLVKEKIPFKIKFIIEITDSVYGNSSVIITKRKV